MTVTLKLRFDVKISNKATEAQLVRALRAELKKENTLDLLRRAVLEARTVGHSSWGVPVCAKG